MKKIITMFVENSILVNFLTVFILVVGVISIFTIQKELRPEVPIDKLSISATYLGASPEEIEKLIIIPIEDKLTSIYGIERVESLALSGIARIDVTIDSDLKNKSDTVQEIFRTVNNIKDLPDEVDDPIVREFNTKNIPIYSTALYGEQDLYKLRNFARMLQDEVELIKGVSSATITGVSDPTIDVVVDPLKLLKNSLSISEVINTLQVWNKAYPAGYLVEGNLEIPIRLNENLDELKKISRLIIRTNDSGKNVRVRDVSKIKWSFKNDRRFDRYNGLDNLQIVIRKKENADTIKTVDRIRKTIESYKKRLPSHVKMIEIRDESDRIKVKLNSVNQNALLGLFLVVVILLLMLNWRVALVTALGLPVAFLGSIWALELMGYTLNSLTIIGIILVVGMLVDDGIVVAENIFFHFEKGKNRHDAAVDGANEIITPVIGTVLTTIVAFLPLVFMSGIIGKFMSIIPIGVITCLVFSLIECIFILPNHAADFMGPDKSKVANYLNSILQKLYYPAITFSVNRRWVVAPTLIVVTLVIGFVYMKDFKMRMFPSKGITKLSFNILGPVNTKIEECDRVVKNIEEGLVSFKKDYITGFLSTVGGTSGRRGLFYSGTNTAGFTVYLKDENELKLTPRAIVKKLRKKISKMIPGNWALSFEVGRHGPSAKGKAVELEVSGIDFIKVKEVAEKLLTHLSSLEGAIDVEDDFLRGYSEYILEINHQKASIMGISPITIQNISMAAFEGITATKVRKLDDEYEVIVSYPRSERGKLDNFLNLQLKTKYGTYINLKRIAKLKKRSSLGSIKHINKRRTIIVMASLSDKKVTGRMINKKMQKFVSSKIKQDYPGVLVNFGGQEEERREMVGELKVFVLLSLLGIYMILSLVFNSPFYPFFVLTVIPFGVVGALTALRIFDVMVTFPALISFAGLTGIVVNDAIILVSYIRNSYKENGDFIKSLIEGGKRRLRPIFITTVTTFGGLLPAMYELGGQDSNMRPMAIVIGWGLIFATIITMVFIPSFMGCLFDIKKGARRLLGRS